MVPTCRLRPRPHLRYLDTDGHGAHYMTPGGAGLTSPARDPSVLAVGATDSMKTLATSDDAVASFSSSGSGGTGGTKNPDLVAPAAR